MGILNSTKEVIKNHGKFKQWEKEDNDKQAQRQALYQKRQLDDDTLKKAASKGKVIMDVIDIMDTHSEEVGENVETVVMPIAQTIPSLIGIPSVLLGGLLGIKSVKNHYNNVNDFFKTEDGQNLTKIIDKLIELKKQEGSDISNIGDITCLKYEDVLRKYFPQRIFNKKSLQILEHSKQSEVKDILPDLKSLSEKFYKYKGINKHLGKTLGFIAGTAGIIYVSAHILSNIIGTKLQVKASRIARWQSRESLQDPKFFVQYTPEQITQAKNNIAQKELSFKGEMNDLNYEDENQGFFETLGQIIKDEKKYDKWKKAYNPEDKMVKRKLTQEEIIEAQKDKEIIQRITKKINNDAEEYSEDMEVAAGVIIGGTPYLGLGVSSLLNLLINKTGFGAKSEEKHLKKALKNVDGKTAQKIINSKKTLDITNANEKGIQGILQKVTKNINYFGEIVNVAFGKEGKHSLGKAYHLLMSTRYIRNGIIGLAGTLITSIVGALIGLKLQKASGRAGRYKAKQEIQKDPKNFIGFSEKDFEEVKNIKAQKKTFSQKIKETITFLPRVFNDYFEYEKFRKTGAKEDKKLLNELRKLDVSKEQLEEAKNLQRKIFTTFENVDDKSQEYSESIEAVTEMTAPVLPYLGIAVTATPILIGVIKMLKGGSIKAIEKITSFLAKNTGFLKGKTSHKILDEIAQNIPEVIKKAEIPQDLNAAECAEIIENYKKILNKSNTSISSIISDLEEAIKNQKGIEYIKKMLEKHPKISQMLTSSGMTEEQLAIIFKNIKTIYENIPTEDLNKIINCIKEELDKNPEQFMIAVKEGGLAKIIASKTTIKIAGIATATWTALGFIVSYIFESFLAGMQKNAGKLGVMNALEELNDVRYYADENPSPKNEEKQETVKPQTQTNKTQSELLKKYIAQHQK